ncbi:DNA-processing protein DprA [Candidatus Poriferisodalis sp.]|uniref:DNA-processing protein DprA n=1 Tax=Candidatus Poriferisodalis sp. TaxID=3101277 RepID=UPI003B020D51
MNGLADQHAAQHADERAELAALIEWCSLPHIGPARLRVVLDGRTAVSAVEDLCSARAPLLEALNACRGVSASLVAAWRDRLGSALRRAETTNQPVGEDRLRAHEQAGIWLHRPACTDADGLWDADPEPPVLLFGRGERIDARPRCVGIVGTRRCSAYGRTVAKLLGAGLAEEGVAVVSGLATGIDGIAQRAALDAGGPVIGVVGSGLDCVYPSANRTLWTDVAAAGSLLSEYPLGTPAAPWRFPARNRIVAALCEVLVVVESGPTGGSMYTVDAAAERDRLVMAVPGPITSAASAGTNRLIVEGCAPACGVSDVLVALGGTATAAGPRAAGAMTAAAGDIAAAGCTTTVDHHVTDDPLLRSILDELVSGPRSVDELALALKASLAALTSSLARLQLQGWVCETGGWWEKTR